MRDHVAWLQRQYDAGRFVVSGRRVPRTGGVIVARGDDRREIEEIAAGDPFVTGGVATVEIVQFRASQVADGFDPSPGRVSGPVDPTREQAEAAILDLLARRDPGKTICPSDAARALGGDVGFRPLMPLVRDAARALVAARRIEVTQSGTPVDLDTARGAIRLRTLPPADA